MGSDNLTDKQRRFCEEYVIDWNATRAAIAAGYSEKGARTEGSRLLTNANVQSYIDEIQKNLAKLAGVSALRNILELKKIAYSSLSDLKDDWESLKDWESLTNDQKSIISKVIINEREDQHGNINRYTKIELHDKMKAIEMINKMLGYNAPERQEIKQFNEGLTPDQENERIDQLLRRRAERGAGK